VPVVMGARKSDYAAVAPPHSFIHVEDFSSAAQLAQYLLRLNASDSEYNEYFAWKDARRGRFINTDYWCRLCSLAHDDSEHVSWYEDVMVGTTWGYDLRVRPRCMSGYDVMVRLCSGTRT